MARFTAAIVGFAAALAPMTAWAAHSEWTDVLFGFGVPTVAFLGTWVFLALLDRWRRARRRRKDS